MKISIDVDCTPEEARAFLGLPDVAPLNEAMIDQIKARMEQGFKPEELDKMMRAWGESAALGMGEMQKGFWSLMQNAGGAQKK